MDDFDGASGLLAVIYLFLIMVIVFFPCIVFCCGAFSLPPSRPPALPRSLALSARLVDLPWRRASSSDRLPVIAFSSRGLH